MSACGQDGQQPPQVATEQRRISENDQPARWLSAAAHSSEGIREAGLGWTIVCPPWIATRLLSLYFPIFSAGRGDTR